MGLLQPQRRPDRGTEDRHLSVWREEYRLPSLPEVWLHNPLGRCEGQERHGDGCQLQHAGKGGT